MMDDRRDYEGRQWRFRGAFDVGKNLIVILLVPIAFTLLFYGVYSHIFVEDIPLAVLDLDHSSTSRTISDNFEKSAGFEIAQWPDNQDEMENMIMTGQVSAGVVIPGDLEKDIKAKKSPEIIVLIDGSNLVIGNSAYSYAANILTQVGASVELQYMTAGGMKESEAMAQLQTLTFTDRILYDPHMGYFVFTFVLFLTVFIQQAFMSLIGPILTQEKERELAGWRDPHGRKFLSRCMIRILPYVPLSLLSTLLCLTGAHFVGDYPIRGNLFLLLALQAVFLVDVMGILLVLTSFFVNPATCAKFILFLSIPTVLTSGYVWPTFAMPAGFELFVKSVWPMYYYILPAREILLKGAGFAEVKEYFLGAALFAAFWLPVGGLLYWNSIRRTRRKGLRNAMDSMYESGDVRG